MLKFVGISFCILICALILKEINKTFSVILIIAGSCILFGVVSTEIGQIISQLMDITSSVSYLSPYLKIMLKVLGITIVAQFSSDVCKDNGENALASSTELVAKVVIMSIIMPLLETVLSIVGGLLK